jgi:hypothetical protein
MPRKTPSSTPASGPCAAPPSPSRGTTVLAIGGLAGAHTPSAWEWTFEAERYRESGDHAAALELPAEARYSTVRMKSRVAAARPTCTATTPVSCLPLAHPGILQAQRADCPLNTFARTRSRLPSTSARHRTDPDTSGRPVARWTNETEARSRERILGLVTRAGLAPTASEADEDVGPPAAGGVTGLAPAGAAGLDDPPVAAPAGGEAGVAGVGTGVGVGVDGGGGGGVGGGVGAGGGPLPATSLPKLCVQYN